jgi:hypothetical protein
MANDAQSLTLRRITTSEAAQAFKACAGLDPQAKQTPEGAANAGECFAVKGAGGEVAFSIAFNGGVAWVHAAAGGGDNMAGAVLEKIERLARAHQCFCVAFQTMRRGLKRVAEARGYTVAGRIGEGWKLEKHS